MRVLVVVKAGFLSGSVPNTFLVLQLHIFIKNSCCDPPAFHYPERALLRLRGANIAHDSNVGHAGIERGGAGCGAIAVSVLAIFEFFVVKLICLSKG